MNSREKVLNHCGISENKFKLSLIQEKIENNTLEGNKQNKDTLNYSRIQNLTKEIEDNERDMECPVCFELCNTPILMCPLSHEICNQCQPKVKSCPQCREPYKNHTIRHR